MRSLRGSYVFGKKKPVFPVEIFTELLQFIAKQVFF